MVDNIFRKVALERLSSPEQLDQLMRVTTPRGWVALIAAMGLLIGAVLWGFFGTIPEKVMGQGILMKSGGVFNIVSNSTGRVQNIYFGVDDIVTSGQIVARLEQPEILKQIKAARAHVQELMEEQDRVANFRTESMKLEHESMATQKANLARTITTLKDHVRYLQEKIATQESILKKGLITKQQLINTQKDLNDTRQQIRNHQEQLKQLTIRELQLKNQQETELKSIEQKINVARRNLEQLSDELNHRSKVISPYSGRILEIVADEGAMVGEGTPIFKIELVGKDVKNLEAVLFFNPRQGKRIQLGMPTQISPSTAKQEKYGFILGMVTYVSEFPATQQGMMRNLQNDTLVQNLSQGGAPIEVRADLVPDSHTPSGYKWSSSDGPAIEIHSGTLCYSSVTISEQRPITLVIPILKRFFLGAGEN